jgi:hypothetical protein
MAGPPSPEGKLVHGAGPVPTAGGKGLLFHKNIFRAAAFALALPVLAGCASGPTFSDMHASEPAVQPEKVRVYFYRKDGMIGAAIQPSVRNDGEVVGSAIPGGYFYADRLPGTYEISTSTETTESIRLTLKPGEPRYVRLDVAMGVLVGHVGPTLVMAEQGESEIYKCHYAPLAPAAKSGETKKRPL